MKMGRSVVILTSLLTVSLAPAQEVAKQVFRSTSPSVVVVIAYDDKGQPLSLGTGFSVGDGLIATNFHVIHNAFKLRLFKAVGGGEITVAGVKGIDNKRDLAIIATSAKITPLLIRTTPVDVGEAVYAIGNPRGLDATLSSGIVSARRESEDPTLYQITAPISPGSSGGPVMTGSGEVIGVATSYLEYGQNLNFAVQGRYLQDLISTSQSRSAIDVATCSGAKLPASQTPSVNSVRVVKPNWEGTGEKLKEHYGDGWLSYKLKFNLSIANDGDKTLKSVDLLILIYDEEGKELIHALKTTLPTDVQPKLAERQEFEVGGLKFNVFDARNWRMAFRVLSFTTG